MVPDCLPVHHSYMIGAVPFVISCPHLFPSTRGGILRGYLLLFSPRPCQQSIPFAAEGEPRPRTEMPGESNTWGVPLL